MAPAFACGLCLIASGCGGSEPPSGTHSPEVSASAPIPNNAAPAASEVRQALSNVESSLKAGSVDQAAAQLVKVLSSGKPMSQEEAAAYRQRLSEAYSLALESSEKGDPKGRAALQLLRAARDR